jgi:AcrR family transcriptional regulator
VTAGTAPRGRPRSFDRTAALHRAMELFWERGYEGTSLSDLTAAMGIRSPSLYAAFGSKEALFKEAVDYYNATTGGPQRELDAAPTARAAVEALLRHYAEVYVEPGHPRGCLVMLAATTGPTENEEVRRFLADCRRADLETLHRRIARGITDGDLPPGTDCLRLARFVHAVTLGMSLQARDGADRAALEQVADCAIAAWDALVRG